MEEKELFQDYELKSWELSPRIYKILGIAAALHLFGFIVIGQVDLLGTKACDSPYVGKVCQVLDAAYVSSVLLGTETEFSSRDYNKTEIEEADVTWVDVSEQFTYPAGYFSQSNPAPEFDPSLMGIDPMTGMTSSNIPGIPGGLMTSPSTLDPNQPAILPTPNPNAVQGPLPDSPFSTGSNPTISSPKFPRPTRTQKFPSMRPPKQKSPTTLPNIDGLNANQQTANKDKNPNANTTANKENKAKTETPNGEESKLFNKKPLEDFGAKYGEAILKNEVDINAPFEITVEGKLDENGKLFKLDRNGKQLPLEVKVKEGSDPKMAEVAREAISAFSDSQLLRPLYEGGVRAITITFSQNENNLMAIIQSDAGTASKAGSIQSFVNLAKRGALLTMKADSDEAKLISKAETATQGKVFILNFLIPNEEKAPMIKKNLEKVQEKLKNQKPNSGVAETANKDVSSAK
ncbi:MAG TPA: hypothetical protein VF604_20580 [Pyrinomonadaceae bacterium]|jgi:hypothetical protein